MKKVLILLMVLGISSLAHATVLTWSVDGVTLDVDEVVNVTLSADDNSTYDRKWVGADSSAVAEILDLVERAAAGEDADVRDPTVTTYPGWWTVQALDTTGTPGDTIASGVQYDVSIKGLAVGTYIIASDSYGTNDSLTIVVPEPITIVLLGLGGLLLRRRK